MVFCFQTGHPYDYRVTLLEKMRTRRLHYGSAIVRQGDLVNSIIIICRGEALLKINPEKLSQQYKLGGDQKPLTVIQKRRKILKRGYVTAEEMIKRKNVKVATLGVCEIIGDVEFVLGRSKHHCTAIANTEMLVMEMELTELQRLMAKRDGGVSDGGVSFYTTRFYANSRVGLTVVQKVTQIISYISGVKVYETMDS